MVKKLLLIDPNSVLSAVCGIQIRLFKKCMVSIDLGILGVLFTEPSTKTGPRFESGTFLKAGRRANQRASPRTPKFPLRSFIFLDSAISSWRVFSFDWRAFWGIESVLSCPTLGEINNFFTLITEATRGF
jgi:hypothetical protein